MTIAFTKSTLPFGWLGNMAGGYPIKDPQGKEWKSTEALFQALRFEDQEIREKIRAAKNGFAAKIVAKQHADKMKVSPLSDADLENMMDVLRFKIDQHPNLKAELLATGNQLIVEDVTARGLGGRNGFWGAALKNGKWEGQNILGKMWMEVRMSLRHGELVDKKYSTGLSELEELELDAIDSRYDEADVVKTVTDRLEIFFRNFVFAEDTAYLDGLVDKALTKLDKRLSQAAPQNKLSAEEEARIDKIVDDLTSGCLLDGDY